MYRGVKSTIMIENKFTMIPYWIHDLTIPLVGSMTIGITVAPYTLKIPLPN